VAKVRAEYSDPQRRQMLIGMILEDKVLDVIEGKANIREGQPGAAQAPEESPVKTESPEIASEASKSVEATEGESSEDRR